MNVSRVVIAGLYGEGGKTTVATGIMGAFTKKRATSSSLQIRSRPHRRHIPHRSNQKTVKTPRRVAHVAKNSARELRKISQKR